MPRLERPSRRRALLTAREHRERLRPLGDQLVVGAVALGPPVLRLHRDKLPVDDLLLVLYYADQGSESDEKLRILASIAQTTPTAGARRITIG
jgi:hypothetical protein